ncbi:hypothetical protein [Streptomyces sp. NPDC051776]|uniref:hypothetical protein n=1 Tax=Streptomyces sp. NPDC051776 TaxID=3155414 RepID=UPI0034494526
MTQPRPSRGSRMCPACEGFASAAITLGGRDRHGKLRTITAHCPDCQGTGTTRRRTPAQVGARA